MAIGAAIAKPQAHEREAAKALLWIVYQEGLQREAAIEVLSEIAQSYDQDVELLSAVGDCLEGVRDISDLNASPPDSTVFYTVVERLAALAKSCEGLPEQKRIFGARGAAASLLGRQCDAIAENSYRKLTEIDPGDSEHHYNLGLFYKTRGRFAEGVTSNQMAARLAVVRIAGATPASITPVTREWKSTSSSAASPPRATSRLLNFCT